MTDGERLVWSTNPGATLHIVYFGPERPKDICP